MKHLVVIVCLAMCAPRPAHAQLTVERTSDNVTVRAAQGLEDLSDWALSSTPSALTSIYRDLPDLPRPERIEVRLVHRAKDIATVAPQGSSPPLWADGVAYSRLGLVIIATERRGEPIDVEKTLRHELAHLALGAAVGGPIPRWLNEGFAFLHSEDFNVARMQTLTAMAWSQNTYPLQALSSHFPHEKEGAHRAYAQAYDFVAFLTRRGRYSDNNDDGDRWAFRDFIKAIADGYEPNEAAELVYSASLRELEVEWHSDLRTRFLTVPIGLFGAGLWVLAALLLILAYIRKTLHKRRTLARWELEEALVNGESGPDVLR